jgi:hypothetical protein
MESTDGVLRPEIRQFRRVRPDGANFVVCDLMAYRRAADFALPPATWTNFAWQLPGNLAV